MRSTATELGTPSTRSSSVRSRAADALEPGVPRRLGELSRTAAATFAQRSSAARSAHVAVPPCCPQALSTSVEKRSVRDHPPRPGAIRGTVGEVPAPGAGREGERDVSSALEASQGPFPGASTRRRRTEFEWSAPQARTRPDCRSRRTIHWTSLAPAAHCPAARPQWHPPPKGPPSARAFEEAMREEDVPAQQPEAEEEARLPAPHADRRAVVERDPAPSGQGPQPPVGLIWRIRDRASFRARHGARAVAEGRLSVTGAPRRPTPAARRLCDRPSRRQRGRAQPSPAPAPRCGRAGEADALARRARTSSAPARARAPSAVRASWSHAPRDRW